MCHCILKAGFSPPAEEGKLNLPAQHLLQDDSQTADLVDMNVPCLEGAAECVACQPVCVYVCCVCMCVCVCVGVCMCVTHITHTHISITQVKM
jgi:hypothetical protein